MGAVYEAKHPLIEKRVAIKLLKPERSAHPELAQRFLNEARATSAIRHPNIVEVMDLGTLPNGAPYLVMELLEGETLADRLDRVGRLALPVALEFTFQTASALEAAHARGIVHRDLKPDNVFLVADPRLPGRELVKVLDFGIAKLRGELVTAPLDTIAGAVLGTPPYMSPEQCRGVPEQIDHRTDIYALGVMLYEMVCGAPPFVSEGIGDMLMMHMSVPPPPPASLGIELPEQVERAILRALAKRPEERFASMGELRAALEPPAPSVVVLPAAVPIDAERYVVQAVTGGGRRSAAPYRPDEPLRIERARPVSGTAARPDAAGLAPANAAELATAPDELDLARAARTRRDDDDEDTTLDGAARSQRRTPLLALAGLLCAAVVAAAWLLYGTTGHEPALTAKAASNPPARLDRAAQPPSALARVPMTAVLPAPHSPVAEPVAPSARTRADEAAAAARSARRLKRRNASEGEPAAPGAADREQANSFAVVSAGEEWHAAPVEAAASAVPVGGTAPATSKGEPLAVDSLARLEAPSKPMPVALPQLVAAPPPAEKKTPEALTAPRRATSSGKTAAPPPAAQGTLSIVGLQLQGSLPESVVRRGIERARGAFERCYREAAASAAGSNPGRVSVRFELDELGRVQNVRTSGSAFAPLDRCVAEAMRNASSRRAPDTGIVRGSFQLAFAR